MEKKKSIILEMNIDDEKYYFPSTISSALIDANDELKDLDTRQSRKNSDKSVIR